MSVSALNGHKVDRRVLPSSVDFELELELVALVELAEAGPLDRADMDERIGLAIVARDEAEALHRIEELHRAGGLLASALPLRSSRRRALFDSDHIADHLEVGSGNLAAPVNCVEGQFLSFGKADKARTLDPADVDEHVFTALIALDEAEALVRVEELDLPVPVPTTWAGIPPPPPPPARGPPKPPPPPPRAAAEAAATIGIAATEAVTAAKTITAAEGIEAFFTDTVPLVAPPAATPSVKTHEP